MEHKQVAIARQWFSKYISAAKNKHEILEEQSGMVFSVQSALGLYNESQQEKLASRRLELAVRVCELQMSSGNPWLAMRNLHCLQPLPGNDYWSQNNKQMTLCVLLIVVIYTVCKLVRLL